MPYVFEITRDISAIILLSVHDSFYLYLFILNSYVQNN